MGERAAGGSLTGRWQARDDRLPNIRGAITIETDLPAGTMLHLSGWTRPCTGGEFVSLAITLAEKGGRWRGQGRRTSEPEGTFRNLADAKDDV